MAYVNGFLAPLQKDQLENYKKVSDLFAKGAMANGAISCVESVGEGMEWGNVTSFPRAVDLKDGEVVLFSWMLYPSKEVAEAATNKLMADPDIQAGMQLMVFDGKRMVWGGFETLTMAGAGA